MKMKLSKREFCLCAVNIGEQTPRGFEDDIEELWEDTAFDIEKTGESLLKQGVFVKKDGQTYLSPYIKSIMDCVCAPDAYICIENPALGLLRRIYIRDADYMTVDEADDTLTFLPLPLLPPLIGSYSKALRAPAGASFEEPPVVTVTGFSGEDTLHLEVVITEDTYDALFMDDDREALHNHTDTVNAITLWLLTGLKKVQQERDAEMTSRELVDRSPEESEDDA